MSANYGLGVLGSSLTVYASHCSVRPPFVDPTRNITAHSSLDPEDSEEEWQETDMEPGEELDGGKTGLSFIFFLADEVL